MADQEFAAKFGQVALVTGASSGIGLAFAEEIAARGLDLIVSARRTDRLEDLAARLRAANSVKVMCVEADLANPGSARRLYEAASGHKIGLVVSNAGFSARGLHEEISGEDLDNMLAVNCQAPLHLSRLFLPSLKARGMGGFIMVSSIEALIGCPMSAAYSSMKALVLHLGEALYAEAGGSGVAVLTCCPGATDTEAGQRAGIDMSALPDVQQPRELARMTLDCLGSQAVCFPNAAYKQRFDRLLSLPREDALMAMAGLTQGTPDAVENE